MQSNKPPPAVDYAPPEVREPLVPLEIRQWFRRNAQRIITIGIIVVVSVGSLSAWLTRRATEQTAARIKREHGLVVPASATRIVCKGDAAIKFLDRSAISSFDLPEAELAKFVSQLKRGGRNSPWAQDRFGEADSQGIIQYDCHSPTDDFLHVWVTRLGNGTVRVNLYTDWN